MERDVGTARGIVGGRRWETAVRMGWSWVGGIAGGSRTSQRSLPNCFGILKQVSSPVFISFTVKVIVAYWFASAVGRRPGSRSWPIPGSGWAWTGDEGGADPGLEPSLGPDPDVDGPLLGVAEPRCRSLSHKMKKNYFESCSILRGLSNHNS